MKKIFICFIFAKLLAAQFNGIVSITYWHHLKYQYSPNQIIDSINIIYDSSASSYTSNMPSVWNSANIEKLADTISALINPTEINYGQYCLCVETEGYHLIINMHDTIYTVDLNSGIPYVITPCSDNSYVCSLVTIIHIIDSTIKTSIEFINNIQASIKLYPIPSKSELYLQFNKPVHEISIYDICGRLLENHFIDNKLIKLSIHNYPTGYYFVKWATGANIYTRRFVVSR